MNSNPILCQNCHIIYTTIDNNFCGICFVHLNNDICRRCNTLFENTSLLYELCPDCSFYDFNNEYNNNSDDEYVEHEEIKQIKNIMR